MRLGTFEALAVFLTVFLAVDVGEPDGAGGLRLPAKDSLQHVGRHEFRCRSVVLRLRVMGTREVDVLHVPAVLNEKANWLGCKAE